jgi:peptidoglycan/LPS O-acetylase OafA/YrhL
LKLNNFDLLRIFAASSVMITHSAWHLSVNLPWWSLMGGFPGVPIFFVISGFLISTSYERSSNLKNYTINRLLRIYPGLWCCVLVTIPVAIIFGMNFADRQAPLWVISQLVGVIYTPQFLKDFGFGSYNGSLWTIPVELQFYFLLPVLYWLIRRTKNQTLYFWLAWFTFLAIAFILDIGAPLPSVIGNATKLQKLTLVSFFPHFYLFLTGVLLQRLEVYKSNFVAGKGIYWLFGYLAFHGLMPSSVATHIVAKLLLAITVVSVAYTKPDISHKVLRGNDISYGVYIYHGLMINIFISMGLTGRAQYLILLFCITYMTAYMSWVFIERPFLRRKKQTINTELMAQVPSTSLYYAR